MLKNCQRFVSLLLTGLISSCSVSVTTSPVKSCLSTGSTDGRFEPLRVTGTIYAVGLTYAKHIQETGSDYMLGQPPPVVIKQQRSLNRSGQPIYLPTTAEIKQQVEVQDERLAEQLEELAEIPALLDYEVELGVILLEDMTARKLAAPDYAPQVGYFLANDVTSRSYQLLGGQAHPDRFQYWEQSKSFTGFLPVSERYWIPKRASPNSLLCITLKTEVNGQVRQNRSTQDLLYTPKQLLGFVLQRTQSKVLRKGDVILTGTPEGVILQVPTWQAYLGQHLSISPIQVLKLKSKDAAKYLQPGDRIKLSGGLLGEIQNQVERRDHSNRP